MISKADLEAAIHNFSNWSEVGEDIDPLDFAILDENGDIEVREAVIDTQTVYL